MDERDENNYYGKKNNETPKNTLANKIINRKALGGLDYHV
jgi:hypothetical protein